MEVKEVSLFNIIVLLMSYLFTKAISQPYLEVNRKFHEKKTFQKCGEKT